MKDPADCAHVMFEARVDVTRLEDIDEFTADVAIWCNECSTPFGFKGLTAGYDLTKPMISLDGLELRIPIEPVSVGLQPKVETFEHGSAMHLEVGDPKVDGYAGFVATLQFDKEKKFVELILTE